MWTGEYNDPSHSKSFKSEQLHARDLPASGGKAWPELPQFSIEGMLGHLSAL